MSYLTDYAESELKSAGLFDKDSDYGGALGESVMELVKVFAKQGHSGASAPRVIGLFERVANFKPLLAITGNDDEWIEVGDGVFQNKRCSALFKNGVGGRAHYLDAIRWKTQKGATYSATTTEGYRNRQFVKEFPFWPKTFVIDVIETEVSKDNWEFTIKDMEQLKKVFEYYDEYKANVKESI